MIVGMGARWLREKVAARRQASLVRVLERDYLLRSVELTLRVSGRAWISQRLVEIESLRDGLADYQIGLVPQCDTEFVPPVVTGADGDVQRAGSRALTDDYYVFRLTRPLRTGERARLNIQTSGSLEGRELLPRWSWSSPHPMDRVDLRVVFADACLRPETVRYQVLDASERCQGAETIPWDEATGEFRRSIPDPVPAWTYQFRWD